VSDQSARLGGVPLFSGIPEKKLGKLAERMSKRTFAEGENAVEEGRGGAGFWYIESGSATVSIRGETVRTLGSGDYFGEIALIDDGPRSATVTAATDLDCLGLAAWEFKAFIEENPDAAWAVMETMAKRLRDAESRGT
jgi:CRP/FNR family transcriptional regulator